MGLFGCGGSRSGSPVAAGGGELAGRVLVVELGVGAVGWSRVLSGQGPGLGGLGGPAGFVVVEAEVDESLQVDCCCSGGERCAVSFDASVADSSVAFGDEPGDGPFDHGPVLAVVVDADVVAPVGSRLGEELVVFADSEHLAVDCGGAALPGRAAVTA